MKTKHIIIIGITALVTLSFTFAGGVKVETESSTTTTTEAHAKSEPVGGFLADDKL